MFKTFLWLFPFLVLGGLLGALASGQGFLAFVLSLLVIHFFGGMFVDWALDAVIKHAPESLKKRVRDKEHDEIQD